MKLLPLLKRPIFYTVLIVVLFFKYNICAIASDTGDKSATRYGNFNLPDAGGTVKTSGTQVETSLFKGTLDYGISFDIPAGPGGFKPTVQLSYSLQGGFGLFGLGWNLAITPIERDLTRGIPRYQKDANEVPLDPIKYGERLIRNTEEEGRYIFRLERDSSMTTIEYFPKDLTVAGQRYESGGWVVSSASGVKTYFPSEPCAVVQDSTALSSNCSEDELTDKIYSWHPRFMVDPNGNVIEYTYKNHLGQLVPAAIYYGKAKIEFSYFNAPRADEIAQMKAGYLVRGSALAAKVSVYHYDVVWKNYCFKYRGPTLGSEVKEIIAPECKSALTQPKLYLKGERLLNTTIHLEAIYEYGDKEPYKATKVRAPERYFGYSPWFDHIGDNRRQLVFPVNGFPSVSINNSSKSYFMDVNHDGLPDMIWAGSKLQYRNNPGQKGIVAGSPSPLTPIPQVRSGTLYKLAHRLNDLNGDGVTDYVRVLSDGIHYRPGVATDPLDPPAFRDNELILAYPSSWGSSAFSGAYARLVDIDGDGYDDGIRIKERGSKKYIDIMHNIGGKGFRQIKKPILARQKKLLRTSIFRDHTRLRFRDMNGDGLIDLVYLEEKAIRIWYNTGRFHEPDAPLFAALDPKTADRRGGGTKVALNMSLTKLKRGWFIDANGDGLRDLVLVNPMRNYQIWVHINRGGGRMSADPDFTLDHDASNGPVRTIPSRPGFTRILDIDGDGMEEVLFSHLSQVYMLDLNRAKDASQMVKAGLLTKIVQENGTESVVGYTTSVAEYLRDQSGATAPFPLTLVKRLITKMPKRPAHIREYFYRDGYYDRERRRFLGFSEVQTIDIGNNAENTVVESTIFHTGRAEDGGYHLAGRVKSTRKNALSKDDNHFAGLTTKDWQEIVETPHCYSLIDYSKHPHPLLATEEIFGRDITYEVQRYGARTLVCKSSERNWRSLAGEKSEVYTTLNCDLHGNTVYSKREILPQFSNDVSTSINLVTKTDYSQVNSELKSKHIFTTPTSRRWLDKTGRILREQKWHYDERGLLAWEKTFIDGEGESKRYLFTGYEYDQYGNKIRVVDGNGDAYLLDYIDGIYLTKSTNPLNHTARAEYRCQAVASEFEQYDLKCQGDGLPLKHVDANGTITYFEYDSLHRLTRAYIPALGSDRTHSYKMGDSRHLGRILTTYTLNEDGDRFHSLIFADSTGTVRGRMNAAQVLGDDGLAKKGTRVDEYNIMSRNGKLKESYLPFFVNRSVKDIFAQGEISLPAATKKIEQFYDAFDRLNQKTYPVGTIETQKWGLFTIEKTTSFPVTPNSSQIASITIKETIDELGRKVGYTDGNGSMYRYSYDPLNRLIKITDPAGNIKGIAYNGLDKKTRISAPTVGIISYNYDALGRLEKKEIKDPAAEKIQRASYNYDPLGRLLEVKVGDSLAERYIWDEIIDTGISEGGNCAKARPQFPKGRLSQVMVFEYAIPVTSSYLWDEGGNLNCKHSMLGDESFFEEYYYDPMGRPVRIIDPAGQVTDYDYQDDINIREIPGIIDQVRFNEKGRLAELHYEKLGLTIGYSYRPETLEVSRINAKFDSGAILQDIEYELDGIGQVRRIIDHNLDPKHTSASASYDYDPAGQLITWHHNGQNAINFAYDSVGNMTSNPIFAPGALDVGVERSKPYTPNGTREKRYSYDPWGRLLSSPKVANLEWTFAGRLKKLQTSKGAVVEFAYDHEGKRVYKKVLHTEGGDRKKAVETFFVSKHYHEEHSSAKKVGISSIMLGTDRVAKVEHKKDSKRYFWYLRDHLASTSYALSDEGDSVAQVAYKPYGTEIPNNDEWQSYYNSLGDKKAHKVSYRYTGHYSDVDTGLYYAGARYYDSRLGRFISPDNYFLEAPEECVRSPIECNLYSYARNNPLKYMDPTGKWTERAHSYFISEMFPSEVRAQVNRGSEYVDRPMNQFTPGAEPQHAMRAVGQPIHEAREQMNQFVSDMGKQALSAWNKGDQKGFWHKVGEMLHPIMDSTSPSHKGFQEWSMGKEIFKAEHGARTNSMETEKDITPTIKQETLSLMKQTFEKQLGMSIENFKFTTAGNAVYLDSPKNNVQDMRQ